MTTERERILELVAAGKVTPAEADGLLKRTEASAKRAALSWILDPIDRLGTTRALLVGLAVVAAGVAASHWLGVRFDGALDTHGAPRGVPLAHALVDAAVAWPLAGLVFWTVSRAFARQGRLVDHLAVVGLARIPVLITGVGLGVATVLWPPPPGSKLPVSAGITAVAVALFPVILWQFVLLYRGFRTASGLRGARCAGAGIVAILGAEVLSKVALSLVF